MAGNTAEAARWGCQNPGVAEVVTGQDWDFLNAAYLHFNIMRTGIDSLPRRYREPESEQIKLLYAKLNASLFLDVSGTGFKRALWLTLAHERPTTCDYTVSAPRF